MEFESRFMKAADVADTLQVEIRVVRNLLKTGELRGIQIGGRGDWRIEPHELEAYIQRQYQRTEQAIADDPDVTFTEEPTPPPHSTAD